MRALLKPYGDTLRWPNTVFARAFADANYDRKNNDSTNALYLHVVSNSVMFPQILYDIVLYARHFLPVKFFPEYYFYKLCFELPQNLTWTDE